MRRLLVALAGVAALLSPGALHAAGDKPAAEVEPRVAHHLREVAELSDHFDGLIRDGCPRFATPGDWDTWVESEMDRVILLVAHVEEAWEEAKATGDDDVRRAAKAPARRVKDPRPLVDKLSSCATENGASFDPAALWRRIEGEVPRRRAEIALPRQ